MTDKRSDSVLEFSGVRKFLSDNYEPLTQYGIEKAGRMELQTNALLLTNEYDLISRTVSFMKNDPAKADQVEYFLKRIPLLNDLDINTYDSTDLFLIKKFRFGH